MASSAAVKRSMLIEPVAVRAPAGLGIEGGVSGVAEVAVAVTAAAYWAVTELGITVEALMVLKVMGALMAVFTAAAESCVPSALGATV